MLMEDYNVGYLFLGILLLVAGILIVVNHQKIGDNLASGVASYNKIKIFGLCSCILGIVFIANLHILILKFLMHLIMPTKF